MAAARRTTGPIVKFRTRCYRFNRIHHVILDPNNTKTEYVMRLLNNTFVGVGDTCNILVEESPSIEVFQDGKLVDNHHYE